MIGSITRLQRLTGIPAIGLLGAYLVAGCSAYVGQGNDPAPETVPIAKKSSALATGYWNLQGNSGTSTGNFLGTTDNQPLDIEVNSSRVIHIDPASNGEPNIIAGTSSSSADSPYGATIGGGKTNIVSDDEATVAGGSDNVAGDQDGDPGSSMYATVAGGNENYATAEGATVAGGERDKATAWGSGVLTGWDNRANGQWSAVVGGIYNYADGDYSAVLGGWDCGASGAYSAVLGGYQSYAPGDYSVAAGRSANAAKPGCFVWADSTRNFQTSCWLDNQWLAITTGGAYFYTDTAGGTGVYVPSGGGSWQNASSRTLKNNIQPADTDEILDGVSDLPMSTWSYKTQPGVTHLGPMAEDFYAEFKLGSDDKSIATVDASGVALAAIQALDTKVKALQKENKSLKKQLAAIDAKLGIKP